MFKRILWATDFSEHATHARDWAIHFLPGDASIEFVEGAI